MEKWGEGDNTKTIKKSKRETFNETIPKLNLSISKQSIRLLRNKAQIKCVSNTNINLSTLVS